MSQATSSPEMLRFARRLVAYEAAVESAGCFRVCEKLCRAFSQFVGTMGYRALMERAISTANHGAPVLAACRIASDGTVLLPALAADPTAIVAAETLLIAQFFCLLSAFVGQGVVLTVVAGVWPDFSVSPAE